MDRQSGNISKPVAAEGRRKVIQTFRDLDVYQSAFGFQQMVFRASLQFPNDERFSLTDQIRRSSRSMGANLAEAWAKRRYPAHFLSKLTDADGELQESLHWLDSALACGYISSDSHASLTTSANTKGAMLGKMIAHYESWCH